MPNIIMCDPKGGDPYELARKIVNRTITEYIDPIVETLGQQAFYQCTNLTTVICHNVKTLADTIFNVSTPVSALAFPKLTNIGPNGSLKYCQAEIVDLGELFSVGIKQYFLQQSATKTLIFRRNSIVPLGHIGSLPTAFQNGQSGGTIYIPKALYDHLGDGTASDYKAASNWSTVDGYGTITWAKIEGSIYETQYADGTPIPSA